MLSSAAMPRTTVPPDLIPPEALLADYPPPMAHLAQELRALVREAVPEALERVRTGWRIIGYDLPVSPRRTVFFAWIMTQREHVHLGFPKGVLLDDPQRALGGDGITKQARWLTVAHPDELDRELTIAYSREAAAVASLSRSERVARQMDREAVAGAGR